MLLTWEKSHLLLSTMAGIARFCPKTRLPIASYNSTLESGIDVGQGITVGPGKFVKKNKHRALNKGRA